MKKTPLYEAHLMCRAKLVEFSGWEMPIQYSGIIDEYQAVRTNAGLFDVSHMARLEVQGREVVPYLQRVLTSDIQKINPLSSQYSMICNPVGGVKDDIYVYRLTADKFLLCINSSNREKIYEWLKEQHDRGKESIKICDNSEEISQLALQGPKSKTILQKGSGHSLEALKLRQCLEGQLFGVSCLISRTGYTGEFGYELYVPANYVRRVWENLIEAGTIDGLKLAGLGARDLLRLDMGYFLYGNDLTENTTPIEAGVEWLVAWDKGPFVGHEILRQQKEHGALKRLIAFELLEKAVPRHGMKIFKDDSEIGQVASGNLSPILQKGIGLAYVKPYSSNFGDLFDVEIRNRRVPAHVVKLPFYRKPSRVA